MTLNDAGNKNNTYDYYISISLIAIVVTATLMHDEVTNVVLALIDLVYCNRLLMNKCSKNRRYFKT